MEYDKVFTTKETNLDVYRVERFAERIFIKSAVLYLSSWQEVERPRVKYLPT